MTDNMRLAMWAGSSAGDKKLDASATFTIIVSDTRGSVTNSNLVLILF